MEKIVEIKGRKFTFAPYTLKAQAEIRDECLELDSLTGKHKIKMGTYQLLVVLHSLRSWDISINGSPLALSKENFNTFFPKECLDEAFVTAEEVNTLGEQRKNL